MATEEESVHGVWKSRWTFVLAATGSAVGLGNIWKFPYMAGENGGGVFVLVYFACVALIGLPVLMAETLLGRLGRQSPINTMRSLTRDNHLNPVWGGIGWLGALAGLLILSFYSMVAGWALAYVVKLALGTFSGAEAGAVASTFSALTSAPWTQIFWHTLFLVPTFWVVARGINEGLEDAIQLLMPVLFALLILLLGYSLTSEGFDEGIAFLFEFKLSNLTANSVLEAMGQAFFTLSLGMGAIMAYGAYMPRQNSVAKTAVSVALMDTAVAVCAGVAIFPIVFANGLEPGQGPGLVFKTLPLAFGQMPGGTFFGTVFFVLLAVAAWSSAISLAEPITAWVVEHRAWSRTFAALIMGAVVWLLGIGSILSGSIFSFFDYLTANIMLPLGGLLIAVFVAWVMREEPVKRELAMQSQFLYRAWRLILAWLSPLAVAAIFVFTLWKSLG